MATPKKKAPKKKEVSPQSQVQKRKKDKMPFDEFMKLLMQVSPNKKGEEKI